VTSHTITSKIKRITGEKAGHCGTLDPDATGVMLVLLGKATKISDLLKTDKAYIATVKLGIKTSTGDISGTVIEENNKIINKSEVEVSLNDFKGKIMQTPPMYSAIKQNGVKLYEIARKGLIVERKPREIQIYNISLKSFNNDEFDIEVYCSKGTYIRTLCEDIGEKLGTVATMKNLCRINSCGIDIAKCVTINEIQEMDKGEIEKKIINVEDYFDFLPKITLEDNAVNYYCNGGSISIDRTAENISFEKALVYTNRREFLGIASCNNNMIKSIWLFV
jgi:tRNA pseudouridine55 synthase